jgi:uncharacterized protein YuzE
MITYDKEHWLLYVPIKPSPVTPFESVTMADSEPAYSEITVIVDYDAKGDLAGVEILGIPPKKPA